MPELPEEMLTKDAEEEIKLETLSSQPDDGYGVPFTTAEEKKLVRKLDMRILPITCLLYLCSFLDRSNLGNARLQGLPVDILGGDASGKKFDWVTSAFFFSYILSQIPATITSKKVPPRVWMASAAVGWGLCSTLMARITHKIYMCDFLQLPEHLPCQDIHGCLRGRFRAWYPLYFSFFYTKAEMGLRMAYWFGFAAVAGAFGGMIAFGIQHAHVTIANWRLLFIIEGIPAIVMGSVAFFFLPNRPESTSFLNEDERAIAVDRMNRATSGDIGAVVHKAHIKAAFVDWRVYMGGVIYFGLNSALASTTAFLPTILKTFGFTDARAQLLTVPPYAVAAIVLLGVSYASDRAQSRGPFMASASFLGGFGWLILVISRNVHARYFATFCITSGTYTTLGLIDAWYAHNLGSETKRATGIPLFMAIGQCGSVLGSHLYPQAESPLFIKGFSISCALEFLSCLCILILSVSYRTDNRRRNEQYGKPLPFAKVDVHQLADKAPAFRYLP